MMSAFGVEHIEKAAWKAWYPVPPGVRRIPRSKLALTVERSPERVWRRGRAPSESSELIGRRDVEVTARNARGREIGGMKAHELTDIDQHGTRTDRQQPFVGAVGVHPGYRRRGVASNMMRAAEKEIGRPLGHSTNRSELGERFARGESAKRGERPVQGALPTDKPIPKKSEQHFQRIQSGYTHHGVQRNRAYRPQTMSRARRGR